MSTYGDSKYAPLSRHLEKLGKESWKASFADIERVLGFKLPDSAYKYPAWWGNHVQNSRHTRAWMDVGWHTDDLDLGSETVKFNRTK